MPAPQTEAADLPEIVLIGKAGAGKSTLFAAFGGAAARVGDGLRAQAAGPASIELPPGAGVLRLTDTAGLRTGDPPPEDAPGRVWLAVARLDDPVQGSLARALSGLRRARRGARIVLALTGADALPDAGARRRAAAWLRTGLERAAGGPLPTVELGRAPDGGVAGLEALIAALAQVLPAAVALFADGEAAAFARHRALILRHATGAGVADLVPLLGAVAVPAAQGSMLAALARAMGAPWTAERAAAFLAALGTAAVLRQGAGLAIRQGARLIPLIGPTLGAAAAAGASAAATYALGRAAHAWLWSQAQGAPIDRTALRALYAQALAEGARHGPA